MLRKHLDFEGDPDLGGDIDMECDPDLEGDIDLDGDHDLEADPDLAGDPDPEGDRNLEGDPDLAGDSDLESDPDLEGHPDFESDPDDEGNLIWNVIRMLWVTLDRVANSGTLGAPQVARTGGHFLALVFGPRVRKASNAYSFSTGGPKTRARK